MTPVVDPVAQAQFAAHLKHAADAGLILNFDAADAVSWTTAVDLLIAMGELQAARYAARQMLAARHDLAYARNVTDVLDRLPPADAETLSFSDDRSSEVQVVRRAGADAVVLVFCAYGHGAGIALSMAHRWFGQLPASIVYLRDFRHLFFRDGIPTFGAGYTAALAGLRRLIEGLGARRVACYGYSAGGFAALHYGVDLSAGTVLALSGAYNLEPDLLIPGSLRSESYRRHPVSQNPVNLREVYARSTDPPQALLLYGDRNPIDRVQAEHVAGAGNLKLVALQDCSTHLLVVELIKRGAFAPLLNWLADGSVESYARGQAALSAQGLTR